jgi:hypothetical protein
MEAKTSPLDRKKRIRPVVETVLCLVPIDNVIFDRVDREDRVCAFSALQSQ